MCETAAYFRRSGAIDIQFNIMTGTDIERFADPILKMISSDLGLAAEQKVQKDEKGKTETIHIESQTGVRTSKILPGGWRETLDFDVDLFKGIDSVEIRGVAHMIVQRNALVQLSEYQGPDDAQRALYANALDSRMSDAIKGACKKFVKRDSLTISCD
jgi:hypothetical protein